MLVMEQGDTLHLALGTSRRWLASGMAMGIAAAPTHFGDVSFEMRYEPQTRRLAAWAQFAEASRCDVPASAVLHVRLPNGMRVLALEPGSGAQIWGEGQGIRWPVPEGRVHAEAMIG
jgi:hypothetical protein